MGLRCIDFGVALFALPWSIVCVGGGEKPTPSARKKAARLAETARLAEFGHLPGARVDGAGVARSAADGLHLAMGQNPNRTPSEHPNPHQNRNGWCTYPKMGSHWF